MKKSSSAGSSRGGSGDARSKPASACSTSSGGVKSKPSSASSDSGKLARPSDKLNPKTCDPFNDKKAVSTFVSVYSNGGIPCRLVHGSVKHSLAWNVPIETVSFDPVLVALAEGLKETVHPYAFVARQGFIQLLQTPNSSSKALTVLAKLISPIRNALAHQDSKVFEAGLDALTALSTAVTTYLNQYLKQFMVPLSKRLNDTTYRDSVIKALNTIETNGGKEATTVIKSKIPTYNSIVGPG